MSRGVSRSAFFFRKEAREDSSELKVHVERPETKLRLEPLQGRVVLVRNQNVDAEPFDPSIGASAETDGIGLFRDKIPVKTGIDPFRYFHEV